MFEWRLSKIKLKKKRRKRERECCEAANTLGVVSVLACNVVKSVIIVLTASSITERMAEQGAN